MLKIAVVAVALLPVNALAGAFVSGSMLYEDCSRDKHSAMQFVLGVADSQTDTHTWTANGERVKIASFTCMPDNVIARQVLDVSCAFLRSNPDKRHLPAFMLVRASLSQAFPCR